jgi:endonuclease/exonuclease/phosphatase family metal-dependent hydrolase
MRLVTFNILHGRSPADGLVDLDRFAAAIRRLDPDVLALQEVDCDQPRSHGADLTAIAATAMGATSFRFVPTMSGAAERTWSQAGVGDPAGTPAYGISLLSRYRSRDWRVWRLPRVPVPVPDLRPGVGTRRVPAVRDELRTVVVADVETPLGWLTVANTHLSFLPGWGRRQLYWIRRRLAPIGGPVVLMGDLNLAGPVPSRITGYRALVSRSTFPAHEPRRQIDHILLRGRFGRVTGGGTPELAMSDHRALVVDLAE